MSIATWVNAALPRLPGALKNVVEGETLAVISDFCKESTAWRQMVRGFTITAGDRNVTLTVDDGSVTAVAGILRVYAYGRQLTPYSHAPFETTSNAPSGFTTQAENPDVIVLSAIPNRTIVDAIDAYVFCKPVNATVSLPGLLTDEYWEIIFDGVMGRMAMHPDKPYSQEALSRYHLTRYHRGKQVAKDKANRGFTSNAQNWTFPRFGR